MMDEPLQPLVSIKHHNLALLFCDYLHSINIATQMEQQADNYVILCAERHYQKALDEFKQFIEQPYDRKYQQAAWQNGKVTAVNADDSASNSSFVIQFFAHAGVVTLTVFALCWLVFFASLIGFADAIFLQLKFFPQINVESFLHEPYRLITPVVFHFSWLHIAFNTMWWWQLGGSIEQIMGKAKLVNLLLVSAIISNLGQFIVDGPNFGGLSGVVYALLGYVWWLGWLMPEKGLSLSKPIVGFLLFWLLLGFTHILPVNIANTAHLLGLICGCLLAYLETIATKKHAK